MLPGAFFFTLSGVEGLSDNIDLSCFWFFSGKFDASNDGFDILNFIHSVVVDRITIGNELAFGIPIADGEGSDAKEARDFLDGEVFFRHRKLYECMPRVAC